MDGWSLPNILNPSPSLAPSPSPARASSLISHLPLACFPAMERLICQASPAYSAPLPHLIHRSPPPPSPPVCSPLFQSLKGSADTNPPFISFEKPKNWFPPLNATLGCWNSVDDCFPPDNSLDEDAMNVESRALVPRRELKSGNSATPYGASFEPLSQDMAMGLVLRAASGTGWTTGSGLEGPSSSFELNGDKSTGDVGDQRWPWLSKSPRRRMRVVFTCNVCGERTTRAINPHAYTDGTVFVQCAGCNIFHKLVDNLNLFHELKGRIFPGFGETGFSEHQPYDFLGLDHLSPS